MTSFRLTDQYHGDTAAGLRPRDVFPDRLADLTPQPPRPLTKEELERLSRIGFDTLARYLAAGTCEHCGLNKAGKTHQQICEEPKRPLPASSPPAQPWEPRPSRRLRDAA